MAVRPNFSHIHDPLLTDPGAASRLLQIARDGDDADPDDAVDLDHVVDDRVEREFLVRRELGHGVILLVEDGDVDMLIADVGNLVGLLEQTATPFGQCYSAR